MRAGLPPGGVEQARIPIHLSKPPEGTVMAKTKFRPLHDRVVVKRIDAEQKTKGGIIIPDSAKEKPSQGEITAAATRPAS
jgi:hypothetical protein